GILQAGARTTHRVGHRAHGLRLTDHPVAKKLLQARQALTLTFQHPLHRNTRPPCDDLGDVIGGNLFLEESGTAVLVRQAPFGLVHAALELRDRAIRSEEHTSELQSRENLVCRLLLEKKKNHS